MCYYPYTYIHTHIHYSLTPWHPPLPGQKEKKMFKEIAANILLVKWNPVWRNVSPAISWGISTTSWVLGPGPGLGPGLGPSTPWLDFSFLLQRSLTSSWPRRPTPPALFDAFCISAGQMPLLLLCKFLAFSMSLHSWSCFSFAHKCIHARMCVYFGPVRSACVCVCNFRWHAIKTKLVGLWATSAPATIGDVRALFTNWIIQLQDAKVSKVSTFRFYSRRRMFSNKLENEA